VRSLAAAAIGVVLAAGVASGAESASRIVDRTVLCRPLGEGFPDAIRIVSVWASPFSSASRSPVVNMWGRGARESQVTAGLRTGPGPQRHQPTGALWLNRTRCTRTTLRVPLTSSGLEGGPTGSSARGYDCNVPATVLIRVRAVFRRPTALARDPRFRFQSVARGRISTGYLAVTTVRGRKPIAFASVDDATGKARLFVAPSRCIPD
jgi:hypothetical protein